MNTEIIEVIYTAAINNFIASVFTVISAGLGALYRVRRSDRRANLYKELVKKCYFTEGQIFNARKYYIRPRCQSVDPAGSDELRGMVSTDNPIFLKMNEILNIDTKYRHIILLADSGMGKSSFLLNYYVYYNLKAKRRYLMYLLPLGIPNIDEKIQALLDKKDSILLLDAFDEDTIAVNNHAKRIEQIINLTRDFHKVVITCRTQFFPSDQELPVSTGIVRVGPREIGEGREYVFHKLYLAPFNKSEIHKFLSKRYKFWQFVKRKKAHNIILKIPDISVRPMLLSYVDFLVQAKKPYHSIFEIYGVMVDGWLNREVDIIRM